MPRNIKSKPFSEINVTPFVDVMLVLLIIFMVTAVTIKIISKTNITSTNGVTFISLKGLDLIFLGIN